MEFAAIWVWLRSLLGEVLWALEMAVRRPWWRYRRWRRKRLAGRTGRLQRSEFAALRDRDLLHYSTLSHLVGIGGRSTQKEMHDEVDRLVDENPVRKRGGR